MQELMRDFDQSLAKTLEALQPWIEIRRPADAIFGALWCWLSFPWAMGPPAWRFEKGKPGTTVAPKPLESCQSEEHWLWTGMAFNEPMACPA